MQMAGQTLSTTDAFRRSSTRLKPSNSQSFISFAALLERTMRDISSSSLPEPEPFGCRIARRSCNEHYQRSFRMPSVSLPTPNGCRNKGTMSERDFVPYRRARVEVRLCQFGKLSTQLPLAEV